MASTDEFGQHEVVHTASIIVDMISSHLLEHGAVEANPKWQALVQKALDAAMDVYQTISRDTMKRESLRLIIKLKSFRKGEFTLASGATSKYFFDLKPTMLDPAGASLIADLMLDKIDSVMDIDVIDAVGGMATGGIPLVSVIAARSHDREKPLKGFFVRKAAKDHGTEKLIEGSKLKSGQMVILVEDVTTTGGSIMDAVNAVRAEGCQVCDVVTVVDRLEGALENLDAQGITLHSIFTRKDFDDE